MHEHDCQSRSQLGRLRKFHLRRSFLDSSQLVGYLMGNEGIHADGQRCQHVQRGTVCSSASRCLDQTIREAHELHEHDDVYLPVRGLALFSLGCFNTFSASKSNQSYENQYNYNIHFWKFSIEAYSFTCKSKNDELTGWNEQRAIK